MVKKCLIAIAVVALLATTVQAGSPTIKHDGTWPWTFKALEICTIPVFLEVGHFVQLKDCHKRKITLEQVDCTSDLMGKDADDFPCYHDCEEIQVKANFPAIFSGKLDKSGGDVNILDKTDVFWLDGKNQIQGSTGDWEKLTVCIKAWKVKLWKTSGIGKKKVGTLTILVKPPDTGG